MNKTDMQVAIPESKDIVQEVTAKAPDEMKEAQSGMVAFAILPVDSRKTDPMILARIYDRSHANSYGIRKHVTFLVAWHVDLRTI